MGIPYYFYTIYNKYHEKENLKLMISENEMRTFEIEHLFFDYNSMIHPCAHQVLDSEDSEDSADSALALEDKIIDNCILYTRYVMSILRPKNVYIMIDGVAPRAKMNQQRERRYKSKFLVVKKGKWDSNKITPGTIFMRKLRRQLDVFDREIKNTGIRMSISDSSEPGEGEHKMMKYISEHLMSENKKIAIYGLDADLIMLSLKNVKSKNIVLLRDNTFNTKLKESERTFTYLEIARLKQAILEELGSEKIDDYIMLCFLLGNDFLEHLPSLQIKENGMNVLLKYYKKVVGGLSLVNGNGINIEVLDKILSNIGNSEDYFFKNVYSVYKSPTSKFRDTVMLESIQQQNGNVFFHKDDCIKLNEFDYKKRYYLYYGVFDIKEACRDYLEGLYWILLYYDNHKHDNWSWYYKHHATPFASDLTEYLKHYKSEFVEYMENTFSLRKSKPYSEIEQLCMVLPRESLLNVIDPVLKDKLERIFRADSCDLEEMYPRHISVDILYKEYLWQSKLFLEPLNLEIIRDLICGNL